MGLKGGTFCTLFLNGVITLPLGLLALYVGRITLQGFLLLFVIVGIITFGLGGLLIDD